MSKIFRDVIIAALYCGLFTSLALGNVLTAAASAVLPCVLLVDDDQDNPDVHTYYTSTLDTLGVTYNVWDMAIQGDPSASDLFGYQSVIWFTGYSRNDTFTLANESAVATYLQSGRRFLLSSEDYLQDRGLTSFGQTRLRISSYTSDVNRTDLEGNGYSLGPYSLTSPDGWTEPLATDSVRGSG